MSEPTARWGWHRHKNGNRYWVVDTAVNCTNGAPERRFVIYFAEGKPHRLWIRDAEEFSQVVTWPDGKERPRFCPEDDLI